jgi:aspartyl-tRNA(Asn)/glutamyl-tRNA(Gln) amidotransferase subunit C
LSLDLEQVQRIARLARIRVDDAEAAGVRDQLNGILGLVADMQAAETSGVTPMSHPQDLVLRLREDIVTEADQRERFQAVAPQVEDGLYLVPKVIE